MSLVVPAILSYSREDLEEKLALVAKLPGISRVQIDVVDRTFATLASWPYNVEEGIEAWATRGEMLPELHAIQYEIDLMCADAMRAAEAWSAVGASRFVLHAANTESLPDLIASVRARLGCEQGSCVVSIGAAFASDANLASVEPVIDLVDFVQFMGIEHIGRQGEPFDPRVLDIVRRFHKEHPDMPIQVDGAVSHANARDLLDAGATDLVVGSAILRADDSRAAFERLRAVANHPQV